MLMHPIYNHDVKLYITYHIVVPLPFWQQIVE
jgi:hypothetical protein